MVPMSWLVMSLFFVFAVSDPVASSRTASVKTLHDANFSDEIKKNQLTVVNFYAPWCGQCKKLKPIWSKLAENLERFPVVIAQLDATLNPDVAKSQEIAAYPTLKMFKRGKFIGSFPSDTPRSYSRLYRWIQEQFPDEIETLSSPTSSSTSSSQANKKSNVNNGEEDNEGDIGGKGGGGATQCNGATDMTIEELVQDGEIYQALQQSLIRYPIIWAIFLYCMGFLTASVLILGCIISSRRVYNLTGRIRVANLPQALQQQYQRSLGFNNRDAINQHIQVLHPHSTNNSSSNNSSGSSNGTLSSNNVGDDAGLSQTSAARELSNAFVETRALREAIAHQPYLPTDHPLRQQLQTQLNRIASLQLQPQHHTMSLLHTATTAGPQSNVSSIVASQLHLQQLQQQQQQHQQLAMMQEHARRQAQARLQQYSQEFSQLQAQQQHLTSTINQMRQRLAARPSSSPPDQAGNQ